MKQQAILTESDHYKCIEDLRLVSDFSEVDSLTLDYCGTEDCKPGFQFGPYIRKSYLLHIVLEGCGTFISGDKTYDIQKGDVFFIFPGIMTTYRADTKTPWTYAWIGFHGYRAEEMARRMNFSRENPVKRIANPQIPAQSIRQMLEAKRLTGRDEMLRMSKMLETFVNLMDEQSEDDRSNPEARSYVKSALNFIHKNYKENVKINQIADDIGISRSYLTKIFRQEISLSPQEYLMNFRAQQAGYLLKHTDSSIKEIALNCGYGDAIAFSKAFKKMYSISPKQYRELQDEMI